MQEFNFRSVKRQNDLAQMYADKNGTTLSDECRVEKETQARRTKTAKDHDALYWKSRLPQPSQSWLKAEPVFTSHEEATK